MESILVLWERLSFDTRYSLWLGFGVGLLVAVVVIWYYWIRQLLGHRKFRGTWFNAREFQELINILKEDQDSGRRVMQYDEIQLLREWTLGSNKGVGLDKAKNGYW